MKARPHVEEIAHPHRGAEAPEPFELTGIDHLRFEVGNARQAAHYYATAYGMTCVAYRGPEQGQRDVAEFVLESGTARFVIAGALRPGTDVARHVAQHGDGVRDIAL